MAKSTVNNKVNEIPSDVAAAAKILQGSMSRERRRDLEKISECAIYMINIRIGTGVKSTIKLDYDGLIDEKVAASLRRLNAGEISIPLFEGIKKAYAELTNLKKAVQRKYMTYFEPTWFVPEPNLIHVANMKVQGQNLIPALCSKMAVSHGSAERIFRLRLTRLVAAAWPKPSDPAAIAARRKAIYDFVEQKALLFPSLESCQSGLKFEIDWLGRVPSIKEQMEKDQELRELATAEIADENRRIILQMELDQELETMKRKRELFQKVQEDALGRLYEVIADGINMVETDMARGHVHQNTRKRIREEIDRLDSTLVLLKEAGDLDELAGAADEIQDICTMASKGHQNLSQRLMDLKDWLRPRVENLADENIIDLQVAGMF